MIKFKKFINHIKVKDFGALACFLSMIYQKRQLIIQIVGIDLDEATKLLRKVEDIVINKLNYAT